MGLHQWRKDQVTQKKHSRVVNRPLLLAAAATAVLGAPLHAADFSGETIDFVIPFSEGGGSDKWARFYAPLLSEALPGQPNVVVKNEPGAGSTKGTNDFAANAEPDGLTILGTSGSTQFPFLLDDPRVQYNYADFQIVLASATGGVAYLPADLAEQFASDPEAFAADNSFIYGSQGATRLDLVPLLAWELMGMNVEPVFGLKGRGDGRLMFERGEANIDYQTSSAYLSGVVPLVEEGKAVPMMSWGSLDENGDIIRDPTFPDMPTFKEVCDSMANCETSGVAWDAWKAFFVAGFPAQKMIFLPKGTDADIVQAYSDAFQSITEREDFAEISAARLGVYPQSTGAAAETQKALGTEVSDEAKAFVKDWLKERYGVEL